MLKRLRITKKKGKQIWERKSFSHQETKEFDIQFWKKAGAQARFVAAWQMISDFFKMRGQRAPKLRLRRSVQNIEWL